MIICATYLTFYFFCCLQTLPCQSVGWFHSTFFFQYVFSRPNEELALTLHFTSIFFAIFCKSSSVTWYKCLLIKSDSLILFFINAFHTHTPDCTPFTPRSTSCVVELRSQPSKFPVFFSFLQVASLTIMALRSQVIFHTLKMSAEVQKQVQKKGDNKI